jgi:integrase
MQRANSGAAPGRRETAIPSGTAGEGAGGGLGELHREKHLALNRSGKWEVRWTEWHDGRARTRSYSTNTAERIIAEAVMRTRERDFAKIAAAAGGVTLGVLLDGYARGLVSRGVGVTQLGVVKTLRAWWGDMLPGDVNPDTVEDYRLSRAVGHGTIRRELNGLIACLRWAVKHGKITSAPVVELPPEGPPRATFLDETAEGELWGLASVHESRMHGMGRLSRVARFVCIALETGARLRAIEGLTWDRVDLARGTIDFRDPKLRVTKKRRVVAPITDRLRPVLERAFSERKGVHVLDTPGETRTGFERFMGAHGFEGVSPHTLKHTRITLLLRAGVPAWDVSELTGTSMPTILSVYGHHIQDDRLRAAANRRSVAPGA